MVRVSGVGEVLKSAGSTTYGLETEGGAGSCADSVEGRAT